MIQMTEQTWKRAFWVSLAVNGMLLMAALVQYYSIDTINDVVAEAAEIADETADKDELEQQFVSLLERQVEALEVQNDLRAQEQAQSEEEIQAMLGLMILSQQDPDFMDKLMEYGLRHGFD